MRMMMYRLFTTIGTNKQFKKIFAVFWTLAVIISRTAYFFLHWKGAAFDQYGLFARAMVRLEEGAPRLDSGLAYAYTQNLSGILKFAGNRIEAVAAYQMVLQILWLILLFAGLGLLFGYGAGAVTGCILAVSPWLMGNMFIVWPGNYYMLHFSLVLVFLGYFGRRAGKKGWRANDFGRLCLIATGFYVGVLCIWDSFGFLPAFLMLYILIRNYLYLRKERLRENAAAEPEKEAKAGQPEKGTGTMGVKTQAFVLTEGILIGIFATLMKYTGVTGEAIAGQAMWWLSQLKSPFARYREVQIPFMLWLLGAALAGIACQLLFNRSRRMEAETLPQADGSGEESPVMTGDGKGLEKGMALQGEEGKYIITEDGRSIKLLDNPLPGPKKHIRKEMDFDLDFEEEEKDDFDIEIRDDDDFDLL